MNEPTKLADAVTVDRAVLSSGQTDTGCVCVKFGLITQDTDVEELVELVQTTGREVEESSRVRHICGWMGWGYVEWGGGQFIPLFQR